MYMSLILTDLGYHELINFSFHLLRREETMSRSNSQQEDPCPCANKYLSPFSTLIFCHGTKQRGHFNACFKSRCIIQPVPINTTHYHTTNEICGVHMERKCK